MSEGRYIVSDSVTGQLVERADLLPRELEDQVKGLQRDVRAWAMRYGELKRDKDAAAKHHPLYDEAKRLFNHWKMACNHKRSSFTGDRFWRVLPFLENKKYGPRMVLRAIDGAAYDAFEVKRRNGTTKRFDEWERIFESAGNFEDFCNRAPRGWGTLEGTKPTEGDEK